MSIDSLHGSMADIGSTLREARMRARIDITEVERATKIRARYLRAFENEEWDALPGPVYVKSFLRTYADYVGLDAHALVDEYKRRYERPFDHEPRSSVGPPRRDRERVPRGPLLPPWALIGLVLVAIVVALFIVGSLPSQKAAIKTSSSPAARPVTHPKVVPHRRTAPRRVPTTVTLKLAPTGPVYVCLVDGTGKVLIPGQIFAPGQTVPTETAAKLLLTLGNNSVQAKVNGKPMNVAASASSIGFELTPRGARPLPVGQQPRCA